MAYVDQSTQDQAQTGTVNPQPTATPSTSTGVGGAAPKATTSNVSNQVVGTNAPAQPFQNINAYLTANAPQATAEGQTIAGGLASQGAQAAGDIASAETGFNQSIAAANPTLSTQQIGNAITNPTQFVQNPSDVATFQALNAGITEPNATTLEETNPYQTANTEATNAAQTGANMNNFAGIESYLQGQNPQATQGTAALDTAILQGTPAATAPIYQTAQELQALPGVLTQGATAADQLAAQEIAATQAAQAAVQGGAAKIPGTFNAGINTELQNAEAQQVAANNTIAANNAAAAPLNADVAAYLKAGGTLTGTNPLTALTNETPIAAPTAAGVATPQDYANEAAYAELLGSQFANPAITQATANEAGTFNAPNIAAAPTTAQLAQEIADQATQANIPAETANLQAIEGAAKAPDQLMAQYQAAGSPLLNGKTPATTYDSMEQAINASYQSALQAQSLGKALTPQQQAAIKAGPATENIAPGITNDLAGSENPLVDAQAAQAAKDLAALQGGTAAASQEIGNTGLNQGVVGAMGENLFEPTNYEQLLQALSQMDASGIGKESTGNYDVNS